MVTISVKISRALKARMKRSHIKVSEEVREFLEAKTLKNEAEKLDIELKRHKKLFEKISVEDVVRDIREDRNR